MQCKGTQAVPFFTSGHLTLASKCEIQRRVNYYNEIDPYAAQWLRNLIAGGAISNGFVDERDLRDVCPNELMGYTQCHFFAGIGVWSYALRLAGWPDDKPVWTGSCPCQPFSAAGQGKGFADERHLWPAWFHLISQCRPTNIFGEQVASKSADAWLDLVHTDMESLGYAFGAIPFPSAGIGAPHVRDRIYWTASMANPMLSNAARFGQVGVSMESEQKSNRPSDVDRWAHDAIIRCSDGKSRAIKSSVQPLANGNTFRVGRLRAYGNSICPQAAAEFIRAANEKRI